MSSTKISALTDATSALESDEVPVARSGANRRLTLTELHALRGLLVRAKTAANIDYSDSTTTTINFATVEKDPGAGVTTGASWHYTVPTGGGGEYEVRITSALVRPQSSTYADGVYIQVDLDINGSTIDTLGFWQSPGVSSTTAWVQLQGGRSVTLAAGDTVALSFTNASGATRRLTSGARIEIYRVA